MRLGRDTRSTVSVPTELVVAVGFEPTTGR